LRGLWTSKSDYGAASTASTPISTALAPSAITTPIATARAAFAAALAAAAITTPVPALATLAPAGTASQTSAAWLDVHS
jgi:hypothetical protein